MDTQFYTIILNEPIFLAIAIIFFLIITYSVLKKFFKLLILTLIGLIVYISFLIYSGDDLPGDSEDIINPIIEKSSIILELISSQLKTIFIDDKEN